MNFYFETLRGRISIEIDDSYTEFLSSVRRVVYTCVTNNYNSLENPTISSDLKKNISNVIFADIDTHVSNCNDVVYFKCEGPDPRYVAKIFKLFPQTFMPNIVFSLWIDGNVRVKDCGRNLIDEFERNGFSLGFFQHNKRGTIIEELKECERFSKDSAQIMRNQVDLYRKRYDLDILGLFQGRIIFRNHQNKPLIERFSQQWWHEVGSHSIRDQLSLPVIVWYNKEVVEIFNSDRLLDYFDVVKHKKYLNYSESMSILSWSKWLLGKLLYKIR